MDHVMITPAVNEVIINGTKEFAGTRRFIYPPKIDDDTVGAFEDALREIIPEKIKEFMDRQDELLERYKKNTKEVDEMVKKKLLTYTQEYMHTSLIELEFMEYAVINKWLKYYLKLAAKVSPERSWMSQVNIEEGISEDQLQLAKEHPIEDMYDGNLRVNGTRLIGRCPFHEEKTGSFTIFTDDNHFYCFGCHRHGDAIDFYMWKNKVEHLGDAIKALI